MINPKINGPVTAWLLTLMGAPPSASRVRTTTAMSTGTPTTSAMNTVRRDQSISPIDRSNTRKVAYASPVVRAAGCGVSAISALHQKLEHGLQVVVWRRHLFDDPMRARGDEVGETGI